ncbi:MAG TPA: flagellum-specific ATP synthase FliI, partial [Solirubrobacteraceae bacterium]|nr:flagellum-specific ATP synthase FliI [Solirubrobacteraceae bacterium]
MQVAAQELRRLMAAYRDKRDLISIGAYERGSDPVADRAIDLHDQIETFLCQKVDEPTAAEEADARLIDRVGAATAVPVDDVA